MGGIWGLQSPLPSGCLCLVWDSIKNISKDKNAMCNLQMTAGSCAGHGSSYKHTTSHETRVEKQENARTCQQQEGGLLRPRAALMALSSLCLPPILSPLSRISVSIYTGISASVDVGDAPLLSAPEESCSGSTGLFHWHSQAHPDMVHPQRTWTACHGTQAHMGWP